MTGWHLRPSRLILFLIVLPSVALARFVEQEPVRTIFAAVAAVGCAVGLSVVAWQASQKRRDTGDEPGSRPARGGETRSVSPSIRG
jgi:hypothetical protein